MISDLYISESYIFLLNFQSVNKKNMIRLYLADLQSFTYKFNSSEKLQDFIKSKPPVKREKFTCQKYVSWKILNIYFKGRCWEYILKIGSSVFRNKLEILDRAATHALYDSVEKYHRSTERKTICLYHYRLLLGRELWSASAFRFHGNRASWARVGRIRRYCTHSAKRFFIVSRAR